MTKPFEVAAEKRVNAIPDIMKPVYLRAMSGKSRAAGVKAKCYDCCCWQLYEPKKCTALACPLWPYRPGRDANSRGTRLTIDGPAKKQIAPWRGG
jgi:hypothetical protein